MLSATSNTIKTAALVKTIGTRLKAARDLCNLSQREAAKRLGYRNSSKLSKIENAVDTYSVPLALIYKASKLYEVSVDYLFGASDDWESDARMMQEREVSQWIFETWENARARDMETLRRLHKKIDGVDSVVRLMIAATAESAVALEVFTKMNPKFDTMRAGNRLQSAVIRSADAARHARDLMQRMHLECTANGPGYVRTAQAVLHFEARG